MHGPLNVKFMWKFNPATYAKLKCSSCCAERNAPLGLPINHIIVSPPALPQGSCMSHHQL